VSINGIHGFPASGSSQVQLHASGPVELRAVGAGGTATAVTSEVLYLALPEISKVTLSPGPGVSFETALQLRPDEDWVLDRQIHGILRSHGRATQRLMLDARTSTTKADRTHEEVPPDRRRHEHGHPGARSA
jgi:hypothetical protein